MIKKLIFYFVIVSIFKENESRSARKHEIKVKENTKISIEQPELPQSNKKYGNGKVHFTETKIDMALIEQVEDVKPNRGKITNKGKHNNNTKTHTQTKLKKNEDDIKDGQTAKRGSNVSKTQRKRTPVSKETKGIQDVTSKVLDYSPTSRPSLPLATMDEVLHNKTAQLIHIIQNTEISSHENDPSNISPPDKAKHERRFVIRNFDVLQSYIKGRKGRRFKKNPSLESSRESNSQPENVYISEKKPALEVLNYDERSDDYIISTTKHNALDYDHEPWEVLDAQSVNWDDVETSGQKDIDDENTNMATKGVIDEGQDTNEEIDQKVYQIKKLNKKDRKIKILADTQVSKGYHKLTNREKGNSVQWNKPKKERLSKLQHNAPNIEPHMVKNQHHIQQETKNYKVIQAKKKKERNKQLAGKGNQEKHKLHEAIRGVKKIIPKRMTSKTIRNSKSGRNADHFVKRIVDIIARSDNVSNNRNQYVRSFNDYNDNDANPYVNKTLSTDLNVSSEAKSTKDIPVIDSLSGEASKIVKNSTKEKENHSNNDAVQRTEDTNDDAVPKTVNNDTEEKETPSNNNAVQRTEYAYDDLNNNQGGLDTDREDKSLQNNPSVEVTISFYEDKDMKKNDYEDDFQSNKKEVYRDKYHTNKKASNKGGLRFNEKDDHKDDLYSNKKNNYNDDFHFNKKDVKKDSLRSDKKDDYYKDDLNFDKKDDYNDDFHSNKKDDYKDDLNLNKKDDYRDDFHSNKKNYYKDDYHSNKKDDFKEDYRSNEKQRHSNKKTNNDWEDNKEKQSDAYDNKKKSDFNKEERSEVHSNDRVKAWDRHANNDWGNVGVGDVKSVPKATTRRTTKRYNDYKEPKRYNEYKEPKRQNDYKEPKRYDDYKEPKRYDEHKDPARTHKKGYRDDDKPERSYNNGYKKGNRDQDKPERSEKRWNPHENNNWDAVGVGYKKKERSGGSNKMPVRDDVPPSYVHTALPHRGR